MGYRIGQGFDIHRLVDGEEIVLGGVHIPHNKTFLAHSDGDVLIHAIIDALLGALALGDIGMHYPDFDAQYKNVDSSILLKKTMELIEEKGYKIGNFDSTIKAQSPKLEPHISKIRKNLADLMGIAIDKVSVKAKTMEGLGVIGQNDAIAADVVLLLIKCEDKK